MFRIEKKASGFLLTFSDFITPDEMREWKKKWLQSLASVTKKFGVIADMRNLKPLPEESQELILDGQRAARKAGMERSAIILNSTLTTAQFRRLAQESGIHAWERYINASVVKDYSQVAVDWVVRGKDPDKLPDMGI